MLYKIIPQPQYLKGLKELDRTHRYDLVKKVNSIVNQLQKKEITTQYHNHPLVDYGKKVYELHVEGDVLLVYEYVDDKLILNLLTLTDHKELKNPTTKKSIKKKLFNSLEEDASLTLFKDTITTNNKTNGKPIKKQSTTPYYIDEYGFKVFIPRIEDGCVILTRDMMDETDLEDWEEDGNKKENKIDLQNDFHSRIVENKGNQIKSNSIGIRESLESEYFTKEEIKTLPDELTKYFQEQRIPKYYDISADEVEDKKYVIKGTIDYGEINHDHRYFDEKVKEFFRDKGIEVNISEPSETKEPIDEDGIYSSIHTIQKIK